MRYSDLVETKQLGRAFNHLEDLVFFYGSAGTIEALEHLKDMASESGSSSIRMKWDGNPQIYWGRERAGGPLIFAGHNQWSRGVMSDNPEGVADFIANKSGKPKTPQEQEQRKEFANKFASLSKFFTFGQQVAPQRVIRDCFSDVYLLHHPAELRIRKN